MTRPTQVRLALRLLPFLLLIVAMVWLVDWAGARKTTTYGPTLMAEAIDGRLWLVINEDIFIADANGAVVGRADVERARIERPITALAPLPGGGMLVGSRALPRWYEVDPTGAVSSMIDLAALGAGAPFDSFKLAYSAQRDLVIVTDTSNHRLLALRRDGSAVLAEVTARLARGLFRFPNGVLFSREGDLVVVNTNRHGLLKLGPQLDAKGTIAVCDQCGGPFRWPAMLAEAPDGSYYVTVLDDDMKTGAVVRLTSKGLPLVAPYLTADAEPTSLVARRDDLLIGDQGRYRILRFDHNGGVLADFGDARVAGALAAAKNARSGYATLTTIAQGALVLVFLGLLWAYRRQQNRAESALSPDGILALPPAPGFELRLSFAMLITFSLLFLIGSQMIVLNGVVQVAAYGFKAMRSLITVILIEMAVFMLISLLAGAWLARLSRKGKFAPMWEWVSARLWNRHTDVLGRYLASGDTTESREMAVYDKRLCLVALTPSQLFVISLSSGRDVRRVRQGLRRAVSGVSQIVINPPWWRRLIGAVPVFAVCFGIARDDCELRFFDEKTAEEFANAIAQTAREEREDAAGLADVSPMGGIGDPRRRPIPVWRQLVLAALVPGLGQLSQGRLWAGILYFTALAVNIIVYMRPVVAHVRRTMDVSPRVLVAASVTMGLVWLIAWIDAYIYTRDSKSAISTPDRT